MYFSLERRHNATFHPFGILRHRWFSMFTSLFTFLFTWKVLWNLNLDLKDQLRQKSMCNICMDSYRKPLVSTVRWHVSCEECWMRALGAKKLCPQCKVIIQPKHLRKIYL